MIKPKDPRIKNASQLVFTVSSLTHELVSPKQYENIVSTISQYHLIPGIMTDSGTDDPWDVVLALLPYSKNTMIDVCLPYLKRSENLFPRYEKFLARYLLFKQTVIGIKVCIPNQKKSNEKQKQMNFYDKKNSFKKFDLTQISLPQKVLFFYKENKIQNWSQKIPIGDFYLVSNRFKMALAFQSEIKSPQDFQPYYKMGCQIVSIVNDQEYNYENFVNRYSNQLFHQKITKRNLSLIEQINKFCDERKLFLLYAGCKTCPSLGRIHYSNSYINLTSIVVEGEVDQFIPLVDLSTIYPQIDFIRQQNLNFNHINISHLMQFKENRLYRHQVSFNDSKSTSLTREEDQNINFPVPLQLDTYKFEIKPMSKLNKNKYLYETNKHQCPLIQAPRNRFFKSVRLSGSTMIRCMYVFNLLNLFLFSKEKQQRIPFTIGVPFTKKTKNLFDILVFIYDKLKSHQVAFPNVYSHIKFNDIVQLYVYKEGFPNNMSKQQSQQLDQYQKLYAYILASSWAQQPYSPYIPFLQPFLQSQSTSHINLISDDLTQKRKFKSICKQFNKQVNFIDLLVVDEFLLPMDIKPIYQKEVEELLDLEDQTANILEKFEVKCRNFKEIGQKDKENQKKRKMQQWPEDFVKLWQEVTLKKHFNTIEQALKYIIFEKEFLYQEQNAELYRILFVEELSSKYKRNVKTLSPIIRFFIIRNDIEIMQKVKELALDMTKEKKKLQQVQKNKFLVQPNSSKPPNLVILDDSQQQKPQNQSHSLNSNIHPKPFHPTPQQIFLHRLQRCKKLKHEKQKVPHIKCHRCGIEYIRKLIEKCTNCHENFCYDCISQISGGGMKTAKEIFKFCPVCKKICNCEKCTKKLHKNVETYGLRKEGQNISLAQIKGQSTLNKMVDQNQQNLSNINEHEQPVLSSMLFKSFAEDNTQLSINRSLKQTNYCPKCQILDIGQKRRIRIQCITCGLQSCYFCIKQTYIKQNYKPFNLKIFHKNWKCLECDKHYQQFIKNKLQRQERQRLEKEEKQRKMIQQADRLQVVSNHTSHYMEQSPEIFIPSPILGNTEQNTKQKVHYNKENLSLLPKYNSTKSLSEKFPPPMSFCSSPQIFMPQDGTFAPPPLKLSQNEKQNVASRQLPDKQKSKKQFKRKQSQRPPNSSDEGYNSQKEQQKHKSKQIQKNYNTGKPLWNMKPNKSKNSSASRSNSSQSNKFAKQQKSYKGRQRQRSRDKSKDFKKQQKSKHKLYHDFKEEGNNSSKESGIVSRSSSRSKSKEKTTQIKFKKDKQKKQKQYKPRKIKNSSSRSNSSRPSSNESRRSKSRNKRNKDNRNKSNSSRSNSSRSSSNHYRKAYKIGKRPSNKSSHSRSPSNSQNSHSRPQSSHSRSIPRYHDQSHSRDQSQEQHSSRNRQFKPYYHRPGQYQNRNNQSNRYNPSYTNNRDNHYNNNRRDSNYSRGNNEHRRENYNNSSYNNSNRPYYQNNQNNQPYRGDYQRSNSRDDNNNNRITQHYTNNFIDKTGLLIPPKPPSSSVPNPSTLHDDDIDY